MKQKIIFSIFLAVLTLGSSCKAQKETVNSNQPVNERNKKGPPSIDEIFKMDSNADGKLSKSEIKGPLLRQFDTIDSNKDGFITKEELQNAPKPNRGQGPRKG